MNRAAPPATRTLPPGRQHGLVLPIVLLLLVILTIAGVGASRTNILDERMVAASRNREQAFEAAEAALRDGERSLQQAVLPAFDGSGGRYQAPLPSAASVWATWSASDWNANGIRYSDNGSTADDLVGVAAQPVYIIEELARAPSGGGGSLGAGTPQAEAVYYRVTARAVGGTTNTVVLLQSIYRRE